MSLSIRTAANEKKYRVDQVERAFQKINERVRTKNFGDEHDLREKINIIYKAKDQGCIEKIQKGISTKNMYALQGYLKSAPREGVKKLTPQAIKESLQEIKAILEHINYRDDTCTVTKTGELIFFRGVPTDNLQEVFEGIPQKHKDEITFCRFNQKMRGQEKLVEKLLCHCSNLSKEFFSDLLETAYFQKKKLALFGIAFSAIRKIPSSERLFVMQKIVQLRMMNVGLFWDIHDLFQFICNMSHKERNEVLPLLFSFCKGRHFTLDDDIPQFINTIHSIPNKKGLEHIEKLFSLDGFQKVAERIQAIKLLSIVPEGERKQFIDFIMTIFRRKTPVDTALRLLKLLSKLTTQERDILRDQARKFQLIQNCTTIKSIEPLICIPSNEMQEVVETFSGRSKEEINKLLALEKDFNMSPIALLYLFPMDIRYNLLEDFDYYGYLLHSIEEKLMQENVPHTTLTFLSEYITSNYEKLGLHEDALIVQKATEVLSLYSSGEERDPIGVYRRLQDLAKEPIDFETKMEQVGEGFFKINVKQLPDLIKRVDRSELPENATSENWEVLRKEFLFKVESNRQEADEAFSSLETSLSSIQRTIYDDNYLSLLLERKEEVSEVEAKFRAILSHILDKNTIPREGQFFTEQQEVFIKIMMGIQHCSGGKAVGIHSSYALLDTKYHYDMQAPKSVEELQEEEGKKKAIQFLIEFLQKNSSKTKEETEQALIEYVNEDTREHSGILSPLLPDYQYWDVSDNDLFSLNSIGVKELFHLLRDEAIKVVRKKVMPILRKQLENEFSGNNALMHTITGNNNIAQGAHHSIYLKNLIGYLVGVSWKVVFDRYTGVLNSKLLELSRKEALEMLFTYITPETVVKECLRFFSVEENRVLLKILLEKEEFWDKELLSTKGMTELLSLTGYFIKE